MTDLFEFLTMLAVPVTFLLLCRYVNRRLDRLSRDRESADLLAAASDSMPVDAGTPACGNTRRTDRYL